MSNAPALIDFARVGEFRLGTLVQRVADLPERLWPRRSNPGRRDAPWRAYLVHTSTGQVGPQIDPDGGSWSIELNGVETGQVTVRKADLGRVPAKWFTPWWGSVLLTYTHQGIERPIVAGPITGWSAETAEALTLEFSGIRRVLERRTVTVEYPDGMNVDAKFANVSLGTLAWRIVDLALDKPGGRLPIIHGTPDESGTESRTFYAWDVANLNAETALQEVIDTEGGPDVMFRPTFTDDSHSFLRWVMVHGTKASPVIGQTFVPDWDTTPAKSMVESVSLQSSADHLATRVWATGAGEGKGTLVRVATDATFLEAGGVFLETVYSEPDRTNGNALLAYAKGQLQTLGDMIDQVSLGVRASDARAPLGSWFVGDKAAVTLAGWLSIPDGTHQMRIIGASGDLEDAVTIQFQEDSW